MSNDDWHHLWSGSRWLIDQSDLIALDDIPPGVFPVLCPHCCWELKNPIVFLWHIIGFVGLKKTDSIHRWLNKIFWKLNNPKSCYCCWALDQSGHYLKCRTPQGNYKHAAWDDNIATRWLLLLFRFSKCLCQQAIKVEKTKLLQVYLPVTRSFSNSSFSQSHFFLFNGRSTFSSWVKLL